MGLGVAHGCHGLIAIAAVFFGLADSYRAAPNVGFAGSGRCVRKFRQSSIFRPWRYAFNRMNRARIYGIQSTFKIGFAVVCLRLSVLKFRYAPESLLESQMQALGSWKTRLGSYDIQSDHAHFASPQALARPLLLLLRSMPKAIWT